MVNLKQSWQCNVNGYHTFGYTRVGQKVPHTILMYGIGTEELPSMDTLPLLSEARMDHTDKPAMKGSEG